jgi:Na+:H+ antiporter, NhaA family
MNELRTDTRPDSPLAVDPPLPKRWGESDRFVPRTFVRPLGRLLNSGFHASYESLWETPLDFNLGDVVHLELSLREWVNDGLMAIFFFVAALEIKRELIFGELRDPRKAALPGIAALGGMIVPALVYVAFTAGHDGSGGWGIPMATDIAFAVGVVTLLGSRVPTGARAFLLTLAIVDDIGGIIVIAIFYASGVDFVWMALAAAALGAVLLINRLRIRSMALLVPLSLFLWYATHESGVHATVAGVALGLACPAWSFHSPVQFAQVARGMVERVAHSYKDQELTVHEAEENEAQLLELVRVSTETMSPLQRNLFRFGPWATFAIIPVFAVANAGVRVVGGGLGNPFGDRVLLGAAAGLVVGKTVGIFAATRMAVAAGVGRLPDGTTWPLMLGLAVTAGVGFTVALFVATLAFSSPELVDSAKVGILAGSVVAGIAGYLLLRSASTLREGNG